MLNTADQERVAEAVAAAEARTSGEIVSVVTEAVSSYGEVPLGLGAAAALILGPLILILGLDLDLLASPFAGWTVGHGGGTPLGALLTAYTLLQAVLFAAGAALGAVPAVKRFLTPGWLRQLRVRRAALQHFAGVRLHLGPERPAILIFVALQDRDIEVVADDAIDAKVGQETWDRAVSEALAEIRRDGPAAGLIRAVELCGAALAAHFPDDRGANAYPNRPLEL